MPSPESLYNDLISKFDEAEDSQMFGKRCAKINGKPFVSFHNDEVAFRIGREIIGPHLEKYADSKLFDPSGKSRPFKDWIQLSIIHQKDWIELAEKAKQFTLANL